LDFRQEIIIQKAAIHVAERAKELCDIQSRAPDSIAGAAIYMACAAAGEKKPMKGKVELLSSKRCHQIHLSSRHSSRRRCNGEHHSRHLSHHVAESRGIISARFCLQMPAEQSALVIDVDQILNLFLCIWMNGARFDFERGENRRISGLFLFFLSCFFLLSESVSCLKMKIISQNQQYLFLFVTLDGFCKCEEG
jgi:hypothetical protein